MVNCPVCSMPISAGTVNVEGTEYHPKCFRCKKCDVLCRLAAYKNVNGKFYCQSCVDKTPELYHTVRNNEKGASKRDMSKADKTTAAHKKKCIIM